MSKLIPDRKVCWVDQYGGHHVGVTFVDFDERPVGREDWNSLLFRHKHTGELEWVPEHHLKDYPMEPIPEPGDVGSCSGGASQPAYDGPATDHPKVDFGYPPGIRKFAAGDHGLLTGDEARKRNAELGRELKNLEDWKHGFEAAKKVMPKENWPRETDLAWEEDREKDMLGQRIHVLTMEDRLKLEEASARRAEKIARIKAMEESLAKWQPVKPKLSDLYRGNQTLCIGVMPE